MNDTINFTYENTNIRVMTDEQGEPLFVLKDICDALDIGNTSRVADRLDAVQFRRWVTSEVLSPIRKQGLRN